MEKPALLFKVKSRLFSLFFQAFINLFCLMLVVGIKADPKNYINHNEKSKPD